MNEVRWGLLSTAHINRKVIPAIRRSERGILAAVASRSQSKADAYARKWDIPRAFGSYQEMLTSGAIDAVYLSLPNHLHAEWSLQALQAGLHVLCEKPLALSLEEVDAMITASREQERVLAEAFMYRHHPQTNLVGDWVHTGRLGEISLIRGIFNFQLGKKQRRPEQLNIRLVPEYGGGSLWDVGVYPISLAQFLMGRAPTWVFGSSKQGETGVDETFVGQLGYSPFQQPGAATQIASSFESPFHTRVEIIGSRGRLSLTRPFTNLNQRRRVVFTAKNGRRRLLRSSRKPLYLGEIEDMHRAILDSQPPLISLEESRNHIATVLALYQSARREQVLRLAQ